MGLIDQPIDDPNIEYPTIIKTQAIVPTGWALEVLEAFSRERPLLTCVVVALHNHLALAASAEERAAAAQRLVWDCVVLRWL